MNTLEGVKRSSQGSAEENKRQRVDECVIHCSDETGNLVSLKDLESWKMLLNAAVIRNREGILSIAKTLKVREIPQISYHRKCRSIFTLRRDLKKLSQSVIQVEQQGNTSSRRSSIWQPVTTQSRVWANLCILWKGQIKKNYSFNVSFLSFHSAHRALQNFIAGYLLETFLAGLVDSSRLLSGYSFCRNFLRLTRYLSVIQKVWVEKKHKWQNWNKRRSLERKTIPFGSSRMFFPCRSNL